MAQAKQAPAALGTPVNVNIRSDYTVDTPNPAIHYYQKVQFTNQAAATCSVYFNPGDVFGAQTQPVSPGTPLLVGPPAEDDITVVYVINTPSGGQTGPYSITVIGCAPVEIDVDSSGNCSIGHSSMPFSGWVRYTYTPTGPTPPATITVNFQYPNPSQPVLHDQLGNPVTSQVLNPGDNPPLIANGASNVLVSFNFSGTNAMRVKGGSGTIKVGS